MVSAVIQESKSIALEPAPARVLGDGQIMSGRAFSDFRSICQAAPPEVFLVLGSGMGPLIRRVRGAASLPFSEVPGLHSSSVEGHRGRLTLGEWAGRRVLISEGRLHFYEGNSWGVVVRLIPLAAELGAKAALLTNAAGGIRDDLGSGALMPIRDHLEWNRPYPWRQPSRPSPYSSRLTHQIQKAGASVGLSLLPGVYAAVTGPSYETPAEIRALRIAGADAVGMSTSREVIAGMEAGMECGAISLITNRAAGLSAGPLNHADVLAAARAAADQLGDVLEEVLRCIA